MFELIKKLFFSKPDVSAEFNLQKKFSKIYSKNIFGGKESRSGEGSNLIQTLEIRRELPKLVRELKIKTFMDAPCGDWYWMRQTSLEVEKYIGVDIVDELIEKNRKQFGTDGREFMCLNLAEDQLPQVDLIFCRDCLVHLDYRDIDKIIANFKRSKSKYLLTTTFTDKKNVDLVGEASFFRALNLELPPFNFPKPLKLINEKCTEENDQYTDKSLGLWRLEDIG
ncbi:MAG: hypothetical protein CVV37_00920 [Nitrospira bacterium HGW-Nitrospira-1]|nr:MAG: hypothetical protein CVV37_00920 [Nitrospira bacterium HGW-Nitrospira-1]